MEELKRIVLESDIMSEDDASWPVPDRVGRQELEIVCGDEHISFTTSKIGSLIDITNSKIKNILLPSSGPEVSGVLANWIALQNKANIIRPVS
ncbi:unnamed protein product [Schistosoma bovis]|nr:unnamed protein product [Schistosoma bovis]